MSVAATMSVTGMPRGVAQSVAERRVSRSSRYERLGDARSEACRARGMQCVNQADDLHVRVAGQRAIEAQAPQLSAAARRIDPEGCRRDDLRPLASSRSVPGRGMGCGFCW